jgi:hypothetical protein
MSTKIYTGFKINTDSFQEAMQIVNAFRPWVEKQAESVMDAYFDNLKAAYIGPEITKTDLEITIYDKWEEMRQKILKEKGLKAPHIDTDFTLALIPLNGFVLGIAYTAHNAWYDEWCKQPKVQEYSYWNNTDAPEEVSHEDWEKRGEDWDVLGHNPVSMQSFSVELVNPNGPMPPFLRRK